MSGVWSTGVLDLIIPSTGTLTPGSGTIYIGGPQLPTLLTSSGYPGAIVFYSGSIGFANGVDYWFVAHLNDVPGQTDGLVIGYKPTSVNVLRYMWDSNLGPSGNVVRISDNNSPTANSVVLDKTSGILVRATNGTLTLTNSVAGIVMNALTSLTVNAPSGGFFRLTGNTQNWTFTNTAGAENIKLSGLGVEPYIKSTGTIYDAWKTSTSAQVLGGVTYTVTLDSRITIDWVVELRVSIVCSAAPASLNFAIPNAFVPALPTQILPDTSVTGFIPRGILWANDATNMSWTFDNTGQIIMRGNFGNPGGAFVFEGTMMYTKGKP